MHSGFPPFQPRWPWLGPDLQTLRNTVAPPRCDLSAYRTERLILPLADASGDRLAGLLQHPHGPPRPLVVLIHGLSGTEDSAYLLTSAAALLHAGYRVLRLNLRGAGASRPLCRLQYHAGRSGDLRDAIGGLDPALLAPGLLLVGYSLGANMLLKFLAEHGSRFPILAAAAVSAPLDLAAASRRIRAPRNRIYQRHLLRHMKEESLGGSAVLSADERVRVAAARSIFEFDDRFVAPRNGYADAAEYYAENSAARFLAAIRVPTLLIHALDDPWIPSDAYRRFAWSDSPGLTPLLPGGGGHVGFHGRESVVPWHDRCVGMFFEQHSGAH
jgi:predicted alpha/beta-fold hydrolase